MKRLREIIERTEICSIDISSEPGALQLDLIIHHVLAEVDPLRLGAIVLVGEREATVGHLTSDLVAHLATQIRKHHLKGVTPERTHWAIRKRLRHRHTPTYLSLQLEWIDEEYRFRVCGSQESSCFGLFADLPPHYLLHQKA